MTSSYARIVARLLSRSDRTPAPPPGPASRARGVSAVELALQARGRRNGRRRWVLGLAAAAVLAGAVALLTIVAGSLRPHGDGAPRASEHVAVIAHPAGQGVLVVGHGERTPLPDGSALSAGSRVVTAPHGAAVLALSTGTAMTLGGGSDLAVEESGTLQRFSLRAGSVRAEVAKLHTGERFVIATPDAEVEVRGTEFRVDVLPAEEPCRDGGRTRVTVTRGAVTVRGPAGTVRVAAGETWPSDCGDGVRPVADEPGDGARTTGSAPPGSDVPAATPGGPDPEAGRGSASPVEPGEPRAPVGPGPAPTGAPTTRDADLGTRTSALAPAPSGSSLAEQNDAFAAAMALLRRGDRRAARAAFEDFLARYPTSPLADSATTERARLLADERP